MSAPGAMAAAAADAAPREREPYLFSPTRPPQAVRTYFRMHRGELVLVDFQNERDAWMDSPHPRDGQLLAEDFRRVSEKKATLSQHFPGRGQGCWTLAYDYPGSWSTALVLAVGSALGGKAERTGTSGMPGGIGVDRGELWVSFLDGGVGVRLDLGQDEWTNQIEGFQTTTIRGPAALAAVFDALRFELPRTLLRAVPAPDFAVVARFVDRRMRALAQRRERQRARRAARAAAAASEASPPPVA